MPQSDGPTSPIRPMVQGTAEGPGFVGIMFCQEWCVVLHIPDNYSLVDQYLLAEFTTLGFGFIFLVTTCCIRGRTRNGEF